MSGADAPDSSIVEKLKKFLTKYGTELLKPYDFPEELMKRLDKLEHLLSNTLQGHKKLVETFLQPSKEALITDDLMRHSQLDIRVSVASCISQIIRITAPDEPYGEDHMKEFFQIVNSAFERLPCMYGRVYSKAVSILHAMSLSQSCVMMLDLGLYASVGHMFHLFLDGIRTKHPYEVFTSMEKIMTSIIHSNVDNDEFSLVLVKILLNNLRRENQNVAPVSFKLAGNTLKNCSADLKTYVPEAVRSLDVPIEDYAEVVVSLFQDATQRQITDLKDSVENVSCPGEAGLAVEADLCNLIEGNETQNFKNDENHNENQGMVSHCFDDPDKLGKAMHMQQEQKPEELRFERKRIRRPSSLRKAEEGYDPFWMLVDWRSMKSLNKKNKNINCPSKSKISKDSSSKPAVVVSDDQSTDIVVKI
ncbi:sister chromatid cohesion protein PDS5 homolog D-like [Salvia miltiorrhiza]|uniref:sister chromatid cohesion protein PDS5 homolog D-like n=1 Tax=Salvia miltiorrhiza TaxID=226208 RepID=UPI0025AC5481|nr:sister chromatid cohesion protein PDS5 homolog D-like [Salvia miltiorrhiza]